MNKTLKLIAASIAVTAASHAAPYNLGTLVTTSGSISIGDKVFSNFGFTSSQYNAADASVSASVDSAGVYHLTLQGPWATFLSTTPTSLTIQYTVETTLPGARIAGIGQAFVLSSAGTGGTIEVKEEVRQGSFAGSVEALSHLSYAAGAPPALDLEDPAAEPSQGDQLSVPLLSKVYVTTVIDMAATRTGAVGATTLVQHFSQVTVPDTGATLGLVGLGLLGVVAARRRLAAN